MTAPGWLQDYSLVVADENEMRRDLYAHWLGRFDVRSTSSLPSLEEVFDASTAVLCVSNDLIADVEGDLERFLASRYPYCQSVLVRERGDVPALNPDHYVAGLERPIDKQSLRDAAEKGFVTGVYGMLLDEHYNVNAALAIPLEDSAHDAEDREHLEKRASVVQERLDEVGDWIDHSHLHSLSQTLETSSQVLEEPSAESGKGTKYHPPECRHCGLQWGVDHGNRLGKGFQSAGAHVWKCRRCRETTVGRAAGDLRISTR